MAAGVTVFHFGHIVSIKESIRGVGTRLVKRFVFSYKDDAEDFIHEMMIISGEDIAPERFEYAQYEGRGILNKQTLEMFVREDA